MGGGSSSGGCAAGWCKGDNGVCYNITDQTDRIEGIKNGINTTLSTIKIKLDKIDSSSTSDSYINTYNNIYVKNFNDSKTNQSTAQTNQITSYNKLSNYQNNEYSNAIKAMNKAIINLYTTLQARQKLEADRKNKLDEYVRDYIAKEKEISKTQGEINVETKNINAIVSNINTEKANLKQSLDTADYNNNQINNQKKEIIDTSYTIAYYEHLLYEAYLNIYNAVNIQNLTLRNNLTIKNDEYSTDNTLYSYQKKRIEFYQNINTFLFYFYYLLIIILVIVILKGNDTSILVKLTLFRLFVIVLILYPLFIIRIQNFLYYVAKRVYAHLFMYDNMKHYDVATISTNVK